MLETRQLTKLEQQGMEKAKERHKASIGVPKVWGYDGGLQKGQCEACRGIHTAAEEGEAVGRVEADLLHACPLFVHT